MWRLLILALLVQTPVVALADATEDLSRCVSESTTGKQRKELARWVFLAMSAHPELKQYVGPKADAETDETNKAMANLFVKLIAEDCAKQARAAVKERGSSSIEAAFGTLGGLAMQELMANAATQSAMSAFEKYVDSKKVQEAIGE